MMHWSLIACVFFSPLGIAGSPACDRADAAEMVEAAFLQLGIAERTSRGRDFAKREAYRLDHDGFSFASFDSFNSGQTIEADTSRPGFSMAAVPEQKARRTQDLNGEPITFITVQDPWFEKNLGSSPIWLQREQTPHEWMLLNNSENKGINVLYAEAMSRATNDLLVFLHPDVILPETFYGDFVSKVAIIEKADPNWGVLGTAGVSRSWNPADSRDKVMTSVHTLDSIYHSGKDAEPVQSLDESFLVLRKTSSVNFDVALPGFDFYGSDICLTAHQAGKNSYLLNLVIKHKTVDPVGLPFTAARFNAKIREPAYQERANEARDYMLDKWCSSGLLPVYGTFFDLVCP